MPRSTLQQAPILVITSTIILPHLAWTGILTLTVVLGVTDQSLHASRKQEELERIYIEKNAVF
jgi:hypothetical protein